MITLRLPDNKANDRAHWRSVLKGNHALWKAADATQNPHPPLHPYQRRMMLADHCEALLRTRSRCRAW